MKYYLSVLRNYTGFAGRARRAEFWWFMLVNEIIGLIVGGIDMKIPDHGILGDLYAVATLLPSLAVTSRRLHDTDRSGWWMLFGLIPIVGWITMLVFLCQDGTRGPNRYGPSPKGFGAGPFGPGPFGPGPWDATPENTVPFPYGR